MDIKKVILKEHSKKQTTRVVSYIGKDPTRFKELVTLFLEGPYRLKTLLLNSYLLIVISLVVNRHQSFTVNG